MSGEREIERWEDRDELLARAAAAGLAVNGSRLARMHRAGLIEKPLTRSLGRGKGRVSCYPPGTGDRLLRVLHLREEIRSFDEIAWRLWWEDGGEVPAAVRTRLIRVAQQWEAASKELAEQLAGEEAGDPAATREMDASYDAASSGRTEGGIARARRNVGSSEFATVFRVLAEVASGRFETYAENPDPSEASPEALFERSLEVDRARSDTMPGIEPWFQGSSEADLLRLSRAVGAGGFGDLAEADRVALDAPREEIRSLQQMILDIWPMLEHTHGPGAFGFGVIGRLLDEQSADNEVLMLFAWCHLRRDPHMRENMRELLELAADARASRQAFEALTILRREVPAFADSISGEAMAAAIGNEPRAQAIGEELRRLRAENSAEVDECIERHPELRSVLSVRDGA